MEGRRLSRRDGAARSGLLVLALVVIAGCSARDVLNGLAPTQRLMAEPAAAYGDGPRRRLSVFAPPGGKDAPVVVFFYGGRWSEGRRADYAWIGAELADRGIVTVVPDYRLYPAVRFPAFVEDGAAAVEWTREHIERYGGDPDRIHVMGHSAGAHIAMLLTLDRRFLAPGGGAVGLAGAIGLAGPYAFLPLEAPDLQAMFGPPERYPESQPIEFARGDAPPLLLIHGLADDTVWPRNTRNLAQAVRARGGCVETRWHTPLGHLGLLAALADALDWLAPVRHEVVRFVRGTHCDGDARGATSAAPA